MDSFNHVVAQHSMLVACMGKGLEMFLPTAEEQPAGSGLVLGCGVMLARASSMDKNDFEYLIVACNVIPKRHVKPTHLVGN